MKDVGSGLEELHNVVHVYAFTRLTVLPILAVIYFAGKPLKHFLYFKCIHFKWRGLLDQLSIAIIDQTVHGKSQSFG